MRAVPLRWNPEQYLKFERPRMQPGLDLLSRLPPEVPASHVVDLGCGTGDLTAELAARYPDAEVTGLDNSEQMLARARERHPMLEFALADARTWLPADDARPEVLFSNATLQWVEEHEALFPRLLGCVAPGGVFAVQMPRNFDQPSHVLMRETARELGVEATLALRQEPVLPPERYYALLAPGASEVELWETTYLHVLEGPDPVLEWTKGTALLPVFERLPPDAQTAFVERYRKKLQVAYPALSDGRTLFPFRRVFMVARR